MPNQLDQVTFNGQQVGIKLATFTFVLPNQIQMTKLDDHTVQMNVNLTSFAPKWMPGFLAALLGYRIVIWNLDTGTLLIR